MQATMSSQLNNTKHKPIQNPTQHLQNNDDIKHPVDENKNKLNIKVNTNATNIASSTTSITVKPHKPATPSTPSTIFKVYAAIDFGTNGTGLAYCIPNTGKVYIHDKWKKFNSRKNRNPDDMSSIKPKTAILLDQNGVFKSYGDDALKVYMVMKDDKSMLFEHFKMNLYNKPHYNPQKAIILDDDDDDDDIDEKGSDDDDNLNTNHDAKTELIVREKLTAVNGRTYPSSLVFIEALKYLKEQAMRVFKRNKLQINGINDVCWILTVPAIWDDTAKAQMTNWAISAGMIDPKIENHLLLRYEPDCASLSIQHEIHSRIQKTNNTQSDNDSDDDNDNDMLSHGKLNKNEKYILCDAGGGTVDIACHQILDDNAVKELIHPSGGPWGDFHVDLEFIDLLCSIFKPEWIQQFKFEEPNSYLELMENFRRSKWTFTDNNTTSNVHNIQIPVAFVEFIEDRLEDDGNDVDECEDLINRYQIDGNNYFEFDGEILNVQNEFWCKYFFDKLINPIINKCEELLDDYRMDNCKYLCIVGGFGNNKYFQKRLINAFGKNNNNTYNLEIIIPQRPILAVVDGAARMAMKTDYVTARILSRTYGDFMTKWLMTDDLKDCPIDWQKKHFTEVDKYNKHKKRFSEVFVPWCLKGTEIKIDDEPKKFSFRRRSRFQQGIPFSIYATDSETHFWTEKKDLKLLVDDRLVYPDDTKELWADFKLNFGGSTLSVIGQVRGRPDTKTKLKQKVDWK